MVLLVLLVCAADPKPLLLETLKKLPEASGIATEPGEGRQITVDEKNGWLEIKDLARARTETTLALFTTATADKIWGLRVRTSGNGPAQVKAVFYRQHGDTFTDVTKDVLDVAVGRLMPSSGVPLPRCQTFDVELPRVGTTVVVKLPAIEECELMGSDPSEFDAWVKAVDAAALRFRWDKKAAKFVEL